MGAQETAMEYRQVIAKREDLNAVIFGVGLLAAACRLRQEAGVQAALRSGPHEAPEQAVLAFVEELKSLGFVAALPADRLARAEEYAREMLSDAAQWVVLYHAARDLEAKIARDLAATIEEAHLAAADPFDGSTPDAYTKAALGFLRSAWIALGEAGYPELIPGFDPPAPCHQSVACRVPV